MAKYKHVDNDQTREMSKESHKNLPDNLRKKWSELPSVSKKIPSESKEKTKPKKAEDTSKSDVGKTD